MARIAGINIPMNKYVWVGLTSIFGVGRTQGQVVHVDVAEAGFLHQLAVALFGLAEPLPVYCDRSLLAFIEVLPAAGSIDSAVRISPAMLQQITGGVWVDACR